MNPFPGATPAIDRAALKLLEALQQRQPSHHQHLVSTLNRPIPLPFRHHECICEGSAGLRRQLDAVDGDLDFALTLGLDAQGNLAGDVGLLLLLWHLRGLVCELCRLGVARVNGALDSSNGSRQADSQLGEGGNLGFTQLGRIEFAQSGGLIYTDAIDNSAGVDCSDHEVNIKILANAIVASDDMTIKQRDSLLESMTEDVGLHVLRDN